MNKDIFTRYASLKAQIKSLTNEMEEIKPSVILEMERSEKEEVVLPDIGKIFFKDRRVWTYPVDIEEMEKKLKADKKVAQQKGYATCEINKDLNFRGIDEQGTEEI